MPTRDNIIYEDLGLIDYQQAWDYQEKQFASIIEQKLANRSRSVEEQKDPDNYLLFCEHPHVFTMGKSGEAQNLLINEEQLRSRHVQFYNKQSSYRVQQFC